MKLVSDLITESNQAVRAVLSCNSWFTYHIKESVYRPIDPDLINTTSNTELKDLRITICSRKSEVTVERLSVCNVIEKMLEHGTHCLACSYTNDVIVYYRSKYDVILISK